MTLENMNKLLFMQEQIEKTKIMLNKRNLLHEYTQQAILFGFIVMFSSLVPVSALFLCLLYGIKVNCKEFRPSELHFAI